MARKGKTYNTCVRFPPEMLEALHEASDGFGVSINRLVTEAVTDFLGRLIPADEITFTRPPAAPLAPEVPTLDLTESSRR